MTSFAGSPLLLQFQSPPSGWRATIDLLASARFEVVSIHALRVEGDFPPGIDELVIIVSIHALREGDASARRLR